MTRAPIALATLLLASCSNLEGGQRATLVHRVTTQPPGCSLYVERLNLLLETPCDLKREVSPADVVTISKDGYLPYRGKLERLRQTTRGTYLCVLRN